MRFVFLLPLALVLGGCPTDETDNPGDTETTDTEPVDRVDAILALDGDVTAGEQVYLSNCAPLCHGTDGTGKEGDPQLLGEDLHEKIPTASDREMVEVILNGEGVMTAFDTILEDQEIADVLAYIKDEFGN